MFPHVDSTLNNWGWIDNDFRKNIMARGDTLHVIVGHHVTLTNVCSQSYHKNDFNFTVYTN